MATSRPMPAAQTGSPGADRKAVFLSGALLPIGFVALLVASAFHPAGNDNDHPSVFALYARSDAWTAVHLASFVAISITVAGMLVLFYALNVRDGMLGLVSRFGRGAAGVALTLTAVRFAVDGVVLKRTVDAWVIAPEADKAARFANAETVRWLEEAAISYQGIMLGLTLILLAVLIVWTARVPWPIGLLFGLGGAGYLVAGWIVGVAGFAPQGALPTSIGQFLPVVAAVYLLIVAWRMPSSTATRDAEGTGRGGERYA